MPWKWCVVGSASTDTEFPDNQTLFVRKCTAMISAPMENERKVTGMSEYHVGCGSFGIYAGTLNSRNKNIWKNKSECTDEALCAVRDYMVQELLGGIGCKKAVSSGYEWHLKDGRIVELRVTIKDSDGNG